MSENRSGGGLGAQLLIALALALVAGSLLAVWLIGSAALTTMGLILVVAVALAVVIGASALPIRAWRRKDFTGEHRITDGTRTIVKEVRVLDGRAPAQTDVKLLQLPAQPQGAMYPELLRAAYAAGRISPHSASLSQPPTAASDYGETTLLPEIDPSDDPDGWTGDIMLRRP